MRSDGALWLKTSDILAAQLRQEGKSDEAIEKLGLKDDVLRRANGFYTYFAADIAYHRNKFAVRGFDKVINIWGADHHGHVARLKGAMDALGLDGQHRLDIVLMQLVKLVRDGETVRMSKRTGKAISLTDLLDEIPVDACRWFFNAKPETQMEFDLGLAVREDSENPVYYVQYAYARICTLVEGTGGGGYTVPAAAEADLSVLTADEEKAPHQAAGPVPCRGAVGRPGLRSQLHQPLSGGAGCRVPQILQRLPHQGRSGERAAGTAEAGGHRPRRAEKRHDAHWLLRTRKDVNYEKATPWGWLFTCRRTVGRPRPRPGRQPGPPSGRQEWCSVSA